MTKLRHVNPWLACIQTNPHAKLRLFCLPYAGGSTAIYRPWMMQLPKAVEVWSIQLPGRAMRIREEPITDMKTLVGKIALAMADYLDKPFVVFGHSMGSRIGFELSRKLRRNGLAQPVRLFASGSSAPHFPDPDPPIHALPDVEFLTEVRRFNGMPPEALESPELLELLLPSLRADFALCETYVYYDESPLDHSVSAYGGLFDTDVTREGLEAWAEQTTDQFTMRMFPGDHFFLQTAQNLFLQMLNEELHQILGELR